MSELDQSNSADNIVEDSDGELDEEEISAKKCLEALENAWLNEKFAPEILPHRFNLVESLLTCIAHYEDNLKKLEKGDIRITIHTMELSRIRYVISSYLRSRLEKIENYVMHILAQENERIGRSEDCYLTPEERKYAQDYLINFETLFQTLALQHMPQQVQNFDVQKFSIKPNLNTHVFLRANKDISGIVIPTTLDEEVDFEQGSQHIIQYSAVADLVKSGDIQLI